MGSIEIMCINKCDRYDPWDRIDAVGGINLDGTRWRLSLSQAISGAEAGKYRLFVRHRGSSVRVLVAVSRFGHKYLKTEADGEAPNNLLSLPECP